VLPKLVGGWRLRRWVKRKCGRGGWERRVLAVNRRLAVQESRRLAVVRTDDDEVGGELHSA